MKLDEAQHCISREKANGESLVEEESTDQHVVECRKRSRWGAQSIASAEASKQQAALIK
jgi:hypothetical protein